MFAGTVTDCFTMQGKGLAVQLTDVEGEPAVGQVVEFLGGHLTVVGLSENLGDGQIVSTRSCLTGKSVAPHCLILLDWSDETPAPKAVFGAILQEVQLL